MPSPFWLAAAAAALSGDSTPRPTPLVFAAPAAATVPALPADTVRRPRAVEVSEGYETRLRLHRWGSYAILPLFAGQYVLGSRLFDQKRDAFAAKRIGVDAGLRRNHAIVAGAVGTVFVANTVTGVWNMLESRGVAQGRTRRLLHGVTMLGAEAGFVATGILGTRAKDGGLDDARLHRNVALGSVAVSTASVVGMWIFNRH